MGFFADASAVCAGDEANDGVLFADNEVVCANALAVDGSDTDALEVGPVGGLDWAN